MNIIKNTMNMINMYNVVTTNMAVFRNKTL